MKDEYFRLFADCILVKGKQGGLIYDLGRGRLIDVNFLLYEVLTMSYSMTINQLKAHYRGAYDKGIDAYFEYFVDNEIGFKTTEIDLFPDLVLGWESPFMIENCILEYNGNYSLPEVLTVLDQQNTRNLQLRVFQGSDLSIQDIIQLFADKSFLNIELYIPFKSIDEQSLIEYYSNEKSISLIYLYGAPKNELLFRENIFTVKEKVEYAQLENVSREMMCVNLQVFSESKTFNAGLNKKICIDKSGGIKNYLSHDQVFGNVNQDALLQVYKSKAFQKKWHVNKDKIEKCKDCKFRYACIYNTDLQQLPNGEWEMISPCSYDVKQDTWKNRSATVMLEDI